MLQVSHRLDLACGVKPSCPHAGMNTPSQANTEADSTERLKRYKAGRVIEFLSICPEFEDLQENNFLEMNFTDLGRVLRHATWLGVPGRVL